MTRGLAVAAGILALMLACFDVFAPLTDGRAGISLTARGDRFMVDTACVEAVDALDAVAQRVGTSYAMLPASNAFA